MMLSISIFAQGPTLTQANAGWAPGATQLRYECDTVGFGPGNGGANLTWNYSGMTIKTNNLLQIPLVNPSTITGYTSFSGATVAQTYQGQNIFYSYTSTQALQLGMNGSGLTIVYSDPAKVMTFPTSYNTTFTDNFSSNYSYSGISFTRTGSLTYTADGWGKLILPGKTFNSVLRIKIIQTIVDENSYYTTNTTMESYLWYDGINKYPVLDMQIGTSSNTMQPGLTSTVKAYYVNGAAIGINETNQQQPSWTIYPNPAANSSTIAIESSVNNGVLEIYNSLGSKVYSQNISNESNSEISLNTQNLTNGIYIVSLKSDNQTWQKKLIINK